MVIKNVEILYYMAIENEVEYDRSRSDANFFSQSVLFQSFSNVSQLTHSKV
jgi:hypothetical protein